jgi:hypothetical protein
VLLLLLLLLLLLGGAAAADDYLCGAAAGAYQDVNMFFFNFLTHLAFSHSKCDKNSIRKRNCDISLLNRCCTLL